MPVPGAPDPERKKRAAMYGVLAGLSVIAAILLGLGAAGVLQIRADKPPQGQLKAQTPEPPPMLEARGSQPPPALEKTVPPKKEMPPEVREWLEHLRKCENLKNDLHREQVNTLSVIQQRLSSGIGGLTVKDVDRLTDPEGTMVDLDTFRDIDRHMASMAPRWMELERFFWSKQPPDADCQKIAEAFGQGLREVYGNINDVRKILSGFVGSGDPSIEGQASAQASLKELGREHPKTLDQAFKDCERLLTRLFIKYDAEQYFHIESDLTGGLLMK